MNEPAQEDDLISSQNDPHVISLLKQIQQQLGFLEKKVDALMAQSGASASREGGFPKHRRPFGNSFHHGKPRSFHRSGPGGGGDFHRERSFDKPREHHHRPSASHFGQPHHFDRDRSLASGFEQPRQGAPERSFEKSGGEYRKPFRGKKKFSR